MDRDRIARNLWGRSGPAAELALLPLTALSGLYRGGLRLRASAYKKGWKTAASLPVPVISIGNLTVGGTGKTPMTLLLAETYREAGRKVGVLTRGYRGSHEGGEALVVSDGTGRLVSAEVAGDEAALLAERLAGIPVVAAARRAEGGKLLIARFGVDIILLDDGFQHLALKRDADLLLMDGEAPFGNGHLLPRGPLREPPGALDRADVVVVRGKKVSAALKKQVLACGVTRVLTAETVIEGVFDPSGKEEIPAPGTQVLAVCGIARPERFARTLEELPVVVCHSLSFADHAGYGPDRIERIRLEAGRCGAQAVITTEKDAVKLAPFWDPEIPLYTVRIGLEIGAAAESGGKSGAGEWAAELLALAAERFALRTKSPHPNA